MKARKQPGSKNVVFKTKWFTIDTVPCEDSSGKLYYRLSCSDSVSMLAMTDEGKIIMVRQYRPAIEAFTYEFPSGYVHKKESPERAMKREFEEETGYRCRSITYIGSFKIVPSRINNTLYVFFGKEAELLSGRKKDKDTKLIMVTPDEFGKLVLNGGCVDSSSGAMFQLAHLKEFL